MKRRGFLKSALMSVFLSNNVLARNKKDKTNNKSISGFIFSDAHIGWRGKSQPTLQEQKKAIEVIYNRFPKLDLVFDTGDIHHGYLNEEERNQSRGEWLEHFASPFSKSFFHYVPGNHELGKGITDTELTAARLGSHNFRPYYSFDYMGIHFISLPQLMDTILITQEALRWLELDLAINKDKTTLIFSHNSLANTTYNNGETGYRVVVNSQEVFDVIDQHKNVVAWLHGHNHQYEIVNKDNRLFVSNGRIGGFNPPESWGRFGQGHLGGIYFEITEKGLSVQCFSATKNDFLENLGYPNLSKTLETKTSLGSEKGFNYYFGHGAFTNGVTHKIYNHYLSKNNIELYWKKNSTSVLNENSGFNITTELFFNGKKINRIIGYDLAPKGLNKKTSPKGLQVEFANGVDPIIKFPRYKIDNKNFMTRGSYYRCEVGNKYNLAIQISKTETKNSKVEFYYTIYNESHQVEFKSESIFTDTESEALFDFTIPNYEGAVSESPKYLKTYLKFINFPQRINIKRINLSLLSEDQFSYMINDKEVSSKNINSLSPNSLFLDGSAKLKYKGVLPAVCLIKVSNVQWQIRNAIAQFSNNIIRLINYRHSFQKTKEVIITPVDKSDIYVNRIINLMPLEIEINYQHIKIKILNEISKDSEIKLVVNENKISKVKNAQYKKDENGVVSIIPMSKEIDIYYS